MAGPLSNLKGKRVLITGGLGFIGSNLAHVCVSHGARVTILDNLDPMAGGNMYNVSAIRDTVRVILDDIRNISALRHILSDIDILFHCAAHTSHSNSMRDPLLDVDVNCRGVITILEAVRKFNPSTKVVFAGTSTQIGIMREKPINEAHPEFPLDVYSANKSVGEKYTLLFHSAYGLSTTVVRLVNTYGPRAHIATTNTCFINYFVGLAMRGERVPVYGDGGQLRSVNYVLDAVRALLLAGLHEKSNGEVYFASGSQPVSIMDLAREVTRVMGGSVVSVPWPGDRRAIEAGDAVVSHHKISQTLGWSPLVGLEAGLRKTRAYYQDCLPEYFGERKLAPGAVR